MDSTGVVEAVSGIGDRKIQSPQLSNSLMAKKGLFSARDAVVAFRPNDPP